MLETAGADVMRIQLRACPMHLTILRAVGTVLTPPDGYTEQDRADLWRAINEVATLSILDATPDSPVDCELSRDGDRVTIRIRSTSAYESRFSPHPLSWHMLQFLVPGAAMAQRPFDPACDGYPTVVGFIWNREDRE